MTPTPSVSKQLRRRRLRLGLTLAEVARRAGTSAATLSRYESGWTRFETYTLRKLAAALGCELRIALAPRPRQAVRGRPGDAALVRQLRRLFWDRHLTPADLVRHRVWVVERVLDYGALDDVRALLQAWGREAFLGAVAQAARLEPRTRAFWRQMLATEGLTCTPKFSRPTAWNS